MITNVRRVAIPGQIAAFLNDLGEPEISHLLASGTVRRNGKGFTLYLTAPMETHRYLIGRCWALAGGRGMESTPAERQSYRAYARRVEAAA